MKKISTLLLFIAIFQFGFGQIFISEDFGSGTWPPAGWVNENPQLWEHSNTSWAGGISPEAEHWVDSWSQEAKLISPVIDLTGYASVNLTFSHFLSHSFGTYYLKASTRSGAGDWNDVWIYTANEDIPATEITISISNEDVGQSDFQFAFHDMGGPGPTIDFWYIDNVCLSYAPELDCSMKSFSTKEFISDVASISGTLQNLGSEVVNSVGVNWQIEDGETFYSEFAGLNLQYSEYYDFDCDQLFDFPMGDYMVELWIDNINGQADGNQSNDSINKLIHVVSNTTYKRPCFEDFTSSTCGPCATLNLLLLPWVEEHFDEITLIKYPVDWPYSGDPYYTLEVGNRVELYNVIAAPSVYVNGIYVGWQFEYIPPAYEEAIESPAVFDIASAFSLTGTEMAINTSILPYADFEDMTVHVIVFEFITKGNIGSNGETEFHHVMMKMVPDDQGTTVNFSDRVPYILNQTIDLSETFIEEFDDLGVLVLIQKTETLEIYQSDYSIENGTFNNSAGLMDLKVDGITVNGFSSNIFEYNIELPTNTTEVPLVTAETIDDNAIAVIVDTYELPGTTSIDVFAEDLSTQNTYLINFTLATGMEESMNPSINLYPNPSNGIVYLSGDKAKSIIVFNLIGNSVFELNEAISKIDMNALNDGIYIIQIKMDNGFIINKKVSLIK